MSLVRRLVRDTAANSATLFALALVPVICAAGAAVDYGKVARARVALHGALDASLAALGHRTAGRGGELVALRNGMESRLGAGFTDPWRIESLSDSGGHLIAIVSADVATSVARLVGIVAVPIRVSAEATRIPG